MATSNGPTTLSYRFDDVVIDTSTFRVQKGDQIRTLAPRAFDLLVYLIQHGDRVVDKQELFGEVWGETFVSDNALTRAVKEIRQAIGDEADSPRYLQTVPKRGYRFIATLLPATSGNAVSAVPKAGVALDTSRWFVLAVMVVLAAAAGFVIWRYSRGNQLFEPPGVKGNAQLTNWPGLDAFPAFSPDGKSIAYSSDRSGSFEIYVKSQIPGAREVQVTSDGQGNFEPAWSPDGQWIAYHSRNRGGIWTMAATGGTSKQVTEFGSYPRWSPDGRVIVFQSIALGDLGATSASPLPPSTLWTVSAQGGDPKRLTQIGSPPGGHGSPSWSPTGKRIVFVAYDGTTCTIWTVLPDGSDVKRVIEGGEWVHNPIYSPDEQSLYYGGVSERGRFVLFKLRVSPITSERMGDPEELLDTGLIRIKQLTISADGKKIAYSAPSMSGNLSSVSLSQKSWAATGDPVKLTQDSSYRKGLPRFSPDGRKVAYVDFRGGKNQDIVLIDIERNETVQVTTDPAIDWSPSWFPDGERIAFQTNRLGRHTIWYASIMNGTEKMLADPGQDFGWPTVSPDGRRISFNSRKSGTTNIWTMGVDGGSPVQMTFDKEAAGWASWSPDSKLLAFSLRRGDDTHVAVMPSSGGAVTQLTFDHAQDQPFSWSPDGDKIAFCGSRNGFWNVYWVSRSSGEKRQLTNYKSSDAYVRYAEWSPRGDQIVYEYGETKGNIWLLELR